MRWFGVAVFVGWVVLAPRLWGQTARPDPAAPNRISFAPVEARSVRLLIGAMSGSQACIDELEIYGPECGDNLALAARGAKATASSCLEGHAIHRIEHLNDGKYGNRQSWIAATSGEEWAQIDLPQAVKVASVVFSRDREGRFRDRMPLNVEVQVSTDGKAWTKVGQIRVAGAPPAPPSTRPHPAPRPPETVSAAIGDLSALTIPAQPDEKQLLRFAFAHEAASFARVERTQPIARVLAQFEQMIQRFASRGIEVGAQRRELAQLQSRAKALEADDAQPQAQQALLLDARLAKRRLMLGDPDLAPLASLLFVKRHPYLPSHNYSDIYDSKFAGGGGVFRLDIPTRDGRLEPGEATLKMLFDGGEGIARDVALDFDARTICFAHRPPGKSGAAYWHLRRMNVDGSQCRQITDGPFHDYYPCFLPDGGIAFVTTRCRGRYLCWIPQAMVLFRADANGGNMRPLSYANISEWGPSIMRDGRILWTRSEYQDKGADYGHTLWAARPDGSHVELIYGNNTNWNLMNGREVPGSNEICATLISHFGDFNGPIALIDPAKGRFNPEAATIITPDHRATSNSGRFRDPLPISRDYVLVSHLPASQWGLYVIDRWGNREILYADARIGSMCPVPLLAQVRPPIPAGIAPADASARVYVTDVYEGLGPTVRRGTVKYLRVVEELRSGLESQADGRLRETYPQFEMHYASPTNRVTGPSGWPTYVAKGVIGLAPVESDGSAHFEVPAGKQLYFQALDADYNEIQRMRSVVQFQSGETRGCIGCHEDRASAGISRPGAAVRAPAAKLQAPPWGAGAFAYEKVVQPVLDARCVKCHDGTDKARADLSATHDGDRAPASYRALIQGGWVNYFNLNWHLKHAKAEPLTFGSVKSRLFDAIKTKAHAQVTLAADEMHALKCWIDLNCPLWPDYVHRQQRPTHGQRAVSRP